MMGAMAFNKVQTEDAAYKEGLAILSKAMPPPIGQSAVPSAAEVEAIVAKLKKESSE